MRRWIAYCGGRIPLEELVINAEMSLIDQSLSARRAEEPTNADGFGPTCAGPPARRFSSPTAIRSATGSGSSCTMD
jgi:predicted glutamine amidotransferase